MAIQVQEGQSRSERVRKEGLLPHPKSPLKRTKYIVATVKFAQLNISARRSTAIARSLSLGVKASHLTLLLALTAGCLENEEGMSAFRFGILLLALPLTGQLLDFLFV